MNILPTNKAITTTSDHSTILASSGFTRTLEASSVSSQSERGFTILFSSIVVAAVLALGISLVGILQRQSVLVSSSEASAKAFYAADTALECAMYWDQSGIFPADDGTDETISCAGGSSDVTSDSTPSEGDYAHLIQFEDPPSGASDICAQVRIIKTTSGDETTTEFESRGFSSCADEERAAERALRSVYSNN